MTRTGLFSEKSLPAVALTVGFLQIIGPALSAAYQIPLVRSAPSVLLFTYFILYTIAAHRRVELALFHRASLALLLLLIVGLLYSRSPVSGAVKVFLMLIPWVLFSVAFFNVFRIPRHVYFFFVGMGIGGLVYVLILWVQQGHPFGILASASLFFRLSMEGRINPIWLGRGMGVSILIMLWYLVERPIGRFSFLALPAIPTMFAYLLATGSKAPVLAVVPAAAVFAFVRGSKRARVVTVVILLTVLVLLPTLIPAFSQQEFVGGRLIGTGQASLGRRLEAWALALGAYERGGVIQMLFGSGTGEFSYLSSGTDIREYPHNVFIEVLLEAGLVGIVLLTAVIVSPVISVWRVLRTEAGRSDHVWKGLAATALAMGLFALANAQMSGDLSSNELIPISGTIIASLARGVGSHA